MTINPETWPSSVRIVIPSYKSGELLNNFLPQLLCFAPSGQITIVDDASNDNTQAVSERFGVSYLSHKENQGKGAALATGFADALKRNVEWIITMDADGQHAPSDLDKFLDCRTIYADSGVIIGARAIKVGHMPIFRIISNSLTSAVLTVITGLHIRDSQCGYRMYSAKLVSSVSIEYKRFEMESEIILKAAHAGFPVSFINIQTLYCSRLSHISHIADTLRWITAVLKVSAHLRFKRGHRNPSA
jgi:glycosyltransferase involved in cell wall biosynthesis